MNWERQTELGETNKHYLAFTYYLELPKESRTLNNAYDKYYQEIGKGKKATKAPETWRTWFNTFMWEDRANARDLYEKQRKSEMLSRVREDFRVASLEDYENSVSTWRKTLRALDNKLNRNLDNAKYDPKADIYAMERLAKAREALDIFGRRQLELPTIISEDRMTQAEDKPFVIEWKEAENKMPQAEVEEMVNMIMAKRRLQIAENTEIQSDSSEQKIKRISS